MPLQPFWKDIVVYAGAGAFVLSLFFLLYSIRKYLELKNAPPEDVLTGPDEFAAAGLDGDLPVPEEAEGREPEAGLPAPLPITAGPAPAPGPYSAPARPAASAAVSPAETFVRGIYEGVSGLDTRLKVIEASLSRRRGGNEFAIKFLEDIVSDFDSLDKVKLRARLEYLLTDLKK